MDKLRDACAHEWFRTGAMEPGQKRCIHCGKWGTTAAQQEPLFKALIDSHPGLADELKEIDASPQPAEQEPVALKPRQYIIRYNADGEFGQRTGWLYRTGGDPCVITGKPVYVWRPLSELIPPQPAKPAEQEPVAWMTYESKHRLSNGGNCKGAVPVHKNPSSASCVPLYTAPQPRREVELTDDEIEDLYFDGFSISKLKAFARAVIAAYKAKQGETNGNG